MRHYGSESGQGKEELEHRKSASSWAPTRAMSNNTFSTMPARIDQRPSLAKPLISLIRCLQRARAFLETYCKGERSRDSKKPPSILFRSEFVLIFRVPPVFFWEGKLKEGMKLSAFFSEWVAL